MPRQISRILLAALSAAVITGAAPAQEPTDASGSTFSRVNFTEHIAPIVFNHCTSCHRPGEGAPFSLMDYKQTKRKARMLARVTKDRIMPPWLPVKGHGEFHGELRLTETQIGMFRKWVENGTPEGPMDKLPKMPDFPDGWQLGQPDLVVKMPRGFEVPAGGPDIYRNFVVPVGLDEDKWISAIEVRPGARAVLHHIIFAIDETGRARRQDGADGRPGFRGMRGGAELGRSTSGLGGWAVGGQPRHLPMGLARHLPKGADIVLQSHFHPAGKVDVEQTTLGLYFAKKKPTRTMVSLQMPPQFGAMSGIDIPPGKMDFKIKDSYTLGYDALALTIGGHAHYICKDMRVWATFPGKQGRESIFWIDRWAFNWQNRYQYAEPLNLPKGTKIDVEITYDNSKDNPSNPFDPPRRITWGLQSTDEMGSVTLLLVAKHEKDSRRLTRDIRRQGRQRMRETGDGGRAAINGFLVMAIQRLDRNGDGKIDQSEIPQIWAERIKPFDTNGDGMIDEKEMRELASGALQGGRRGSGGGGFGGDRRRR